MHSIERIVAACCRHALVVVVAAILAAVATELYTASHFRINTDTEKLVSASTDWRERNIRFDHFFPQQNNLLLIVIDGVTPERAEYGAARLSERLAARNDLFRNVRRPDGGEFFNRHGMLYLSTLDVKNTTAQLIQAQPFLGALAADPSLKGILSGLNLFLEGVSSGRTQLSSLVHPLDEIAKSLAAAQQGKRRFLAWQSLVTGAAPSADSLRRFIEVQPRLNFRAVEPGRAAIDAVRAEARAVQLVPEEGIRVRITGPVALAQEDFASLAERAGLMGAAMLVAVLITLWLAVRSIRIILAIVVTISIGLLFTTGAGLLYAHAFNVISIAFIALFVGLGVDFAIQFSVRYRAERHADDNLERALALAGLHVGQPLALAAAATAAGFLSFLPTNYSGVAELGVVAGIGMLIAFTLSITLLPALLKLLSAPSEPEQVGFAFFAKADAFLKRNRETVLQVAVGAVAVAIILLPLLNFDFNPLDLRNARSESVATLRDLMKNPDTTPNTINVLAPSLNKTTPLVERLLKVPEVDRALTLTSFIPQDQAKKLALIKDADSLLDTTINPFGAASAPSDADVVGAMRDTASSLRKAAGGQRTDGGDVALRLAKVLDRLAGGPRSARAIATDALVPGLSVMLAQLRSALTADEVTLDGLPRDMVRDWVANDGTARIEVYPKTCATAASAKVTIQSQNILRRTGTALADMGKRMASAISRAAAGLTGAKSRANETSPCLNANGSLEEFANAVLAVAPTATGGPISIQDFGKTILRAFIQAGLLSAATITLLLLIALRSVRDVLYTLTPLFLSAFLTLGSCVLLGLDLNFANVIALPLLLGIGVAFDVYFIMAWRNGENSPLSTSLTRAVIFSALTTASGFGSLWISSHPGTASMGELLMISLGWTLFTTLFFVPALLKPRGESALDPD
jgi:hopanoid biosynthesis associated RND transporter like protein HpnN